MEILRWAPKILDTRKGTLKKLLGLEGGSENPYTGTSKPTGGGLLKNCKGAAKISSFEFQ